MGRFLIKAEGNEGNNKGSYQLNSTQLNCNCYSPAFFFHGEVAVAYIIWETEISCDWNCCLVVCVNQMKG